MLGSVSVPVQNEDLSGRAAADAVDALQHASRAWLTYLVKQAHASKLGLIEYLVLGRACDEGGVTARDAARAFDLSTSTMTGISDRLEKDKLVRRHAHPTDRRVLVLRATRRGRGVITRSTGPLLADLGQIASGLDSGERELLIRTFQQISERTRANL
jgi:DNA-binding MarR family transcriptional regulator